MASPYSLLDAFERFCEEQSQKTKNQIATRIALRSLPAIFAYLITNPAIKTRPHLGDVPALAAFRALICAVDETDSQTEQQLKYLQGNGNRLVRLHAIGKQPFSNAVGSALHCIAYALKQSPKSAFNSLMQTTPHFVEGEGLLSASIYSDTLPLNEHFEKQLSTPKLFKYPLWFDYEETKLQPDFLDYHQYWETFRSDFAINHPEWQFWRDWYQSFLDGNPLDWSLQREVALIDNEDWGKGAKHIAKLIDPIWERHKVKERIVDVEALLPSNMKTETSRHNIGGNNPPLEHAITTPEQIFSITYGAIGVLKQQTEQPEPDKSMIKWAIDALKKVKKAIAILVSTFVIGGVGAAGAKYGEEVFVKLQTEIPKVMETASNWLKKIP